MTTQTVTCPQTGVDIKFWCLSCTCAHVYHEIEQAYAGLRAATKSGLTREACQNFFNKIDAIPFAKMLISKWHFDGDQSFRLAVGIASVGDRVVWQQGDPCERLSDDDFYSLKDSETIR